jgi:SAM-dependent methyltransferase
VSWWSDEALAQLAATVRGGTPWRQALDEGTEHRTEDARGNWLWLIDLERWERALDVQGGIGTTTAALSRHFTSVHYLDTARPLVEFARARFTEDRCANVACAQAGASALPYGTATFDCVVWDGALGRRVTGVATSDPATVLSAVLAECRRVLRPGGCLYLGIATGPVPGRVLPAGPILSTLMRWLVRLIRLVPVWAGRRTTLRVRRLERLALARAMPSQLRAAGFTRVQAYYMHPSFQQPWSIIPARRRAVLAFERLQLTSRRRRRWLAWLSLHPVLFDCHVFLAYS